MRCKVLIYIQNESLIPTLSNRAGSIKWKPSKTPNSYENVLFWGCVDCRAMQVHTAGFKAQMTGLQCCLCLLPVSEVECQSDINKSDTVSCC